jgi:hypothetical protein
VDPGDFGAVAATWDYNFSRAVQVMGQKFYAPANAWIVMGDNARRSSSNGHEQWLFYLRQLPITFLPPLLTLNGKVPRMMCRCGDNQKVHVDLVYLSESRPLQFSPSSFDALHSCALKFLFAKRSSPCITL